MPIEQKESFRWLAGYRLAQQLSQECPDTQVISVADSEADIYDIFVEATRQPDAVDFIIRASEPRRTLEKEPDSGPQVYRKVQDEVRSGEVRARRTLELSRTPKRAARTAQLEIRAEQVTVKPPHGRASLGPVVINVVLAEEVHGPDDGTDVCWMLLTSLPLDSYDEILQVVDFYDSRWAIEVYFRALKSGCQVEEIQLETTARLRRCLAFYKIIAWRVVYTTYLNRECPELPVNSIFADCEWKSVWRVVTQQELPKSPPPLSDFMPLLTQLGGYNNRRTEGPPGPQVIWIGIRRMTDFALAWRTFSPEN